jgi:hypothetical protein
MVGPCTQTWHSKLFFLPEKLNLGLLTFDMPFLVIQRARRFVPFERLGYFNGDKNFGP